MWYNMTDMIDMIYIYIYDNYDVYYMIDINNMMILKNMI